MNPKKDRVMRMSHELRIIYGEQITERMLVDALQLDALAYVEEEYKAFSHYALDWHRKNKHIFVLALDGSRVIGYVCAVPLTRTKYNEIRNGQIKDEAEIGYDNVVPYKSFCVHDVCLTSLVVHPDYQLTNAKGLLLKGLLLRVLVRLSMQGVLFRNLIIDGVSTGGRRLAEILNFKRVCESDHGSTIYETGIYSVSLQFLRILFLSVFSRTHLRRTIYSRETESGFLFKKKKPYPVDSDA